VTAPSEEKPKPKTFFLKEFRTLLPYLRRYRWRYFWGFLFLLSVDGAQIMLPQFIRRAIDLVSLAEGGEDFKRIVLLCLSMAGVMLVVMAGRFLWRYFIHGAARRIEAELRDRLFGHLLTLSYDFYQKNKIGDLMARSTNDLTAVCRAIGMGLVALIDGTVLAAAILVIIFIQDAHTAAFAVIPLPLITVLILFFGKVVGRQFVQVQETYSNMSDTVQETFAGIRVVKSFVKEWWFVNKFAGTNDDFRTSNMALVKTFGIFFPLITFLSGLSSLILLLAGGARVVAGQLSAGELVALFTYFQMLIWPMIGAGFTVNMIQRGTVSMGRVNQILNTPPSITSPDVPIEVTASNKEADEIEIRHLSFAYPGGADVLEDISLSIPRGSWVGILGRTGSGKSTLVKAFTRLIDPPPGTVFVRGVDVRDWRLPALRSLFGVTPQDSYLFSDSIKNNMAYGLEEAGEALLLKGAELAALDRDLTAFGSGWDTLIGERGLTLSGGQKQRVAIARAALTGAELLILDDALSAVDAETERRVLKSLWDERRGKTTIIISHRVSALSRVDRAAVLERGRLAEWGSPEELMKQQGFYARTAALQRLDAVEGGGEGGVDV
jgi:ATP-binding cassette subfamily B protein